VDPSVEQALPWIAAALAALALFALGFRSGRRSGREAIDRARDLEERLAIAEEDMGRYRTQVSEHFDETSRLLRDLTLQYRSVYEHLSDGARTLCPDGANLLAPSLAEALPPEASEEPAAAGDAAEADESQLDLELAAGSRYEARRGDADLEPILDEQLEAEPDRT
jgi:uncharacterized membrane-anchored protein YhcB (DUF1043 family)